MSRWGDAARLIVGAAVAGATTWALTRRWTQQPPPVGAVSPLGAGRPAADHEPHGREHLGERDPFSEQAPSSPVAEDRPASGWLRQNFHGETVSLVAGPAVAAGSAAGIALAPGVAPRVRAAGIGTALLIGAVGVYDDLSGDSSSKGLRGHLAALREGRVTTGVVKVGVIGLTGLAGSALVSRNVVDTLVGGAVIAGHANLVNLLDLRPGRAGKVALLHAPLVLTGPAGALGAGALGAVVSSLPDDLGERTMLGDAGANTLGGLLGLAMVARESRAARLAHLAVVTALVLTSEKVSFTEVIEKTPVLRDLDQLGRRP